MLRPLSFTHMCCIIMIFLVGTTVRLTKMYDFLWASQVAQWQRIRLPMQEMQETWVPSLGQKIPWRREWLPIPVFLPGKFHGQRSLKGYSPQVHKESDTTERARTHTLFCMHLFYMLIFCASVLYVYRMPQKLLCFLSFLNDPVLSLNLSLTGGFIIHSHYLLILIKKTLWLYNAGWEV